MTNPQKVDIRITGDHQSVQAVRQALIALKIEGLSFDIEPPRSARKSDAFDMMTHGTIMLLQARHVGEDER